MKNVLIINQSSELYGADKAILELLENYPKGFNPIVVLHQEGPLKEILVNKGIKVIKCSVIKVKRGIFSPKYLLQLPFEIIKAVYTIRKELKGTKIDLIHSNAISVLIGAFYSYIFRIKHLWHVHEIIEHPKAIAKAYPKIVYFFSDIIVFNSNASYSHFYSIKPKIKEKAIIIHNGQNRNCPIINNTERTKIQTALFKSSESDIVIGLVGRISRLKGQKLLLKAFNSLSTKHKNIHLVYVGSPPDGQEHFLNNLNLKITEYNLGDKVTVVDFQKEVWPIYDALDIVVVPSTEPESFGLVATEAMLSFKPVIGSNLGGLKEIIDDGNTGYLFEPKNHEDLEKKLEILISNPELIQKMGLNGNERVKKLFTTEKFVSAIEKVYQSL